MTALAYGLIGIAVVAAWLGAAAFTRMRTPFERLHVVTFVNIVTVGAVMLAAFAAEGVTPRTLKCALIWLATVVVGALLSHTSGRALNLRGGERR